MKKFEGAIITATIFVFVLLFVGIVVSGCSTPRSATYCIKNGVYVKCPKNVEPGTILDKANK